MPSSWEIEQKFHVSDPVGLHTQLTAQGFALVDTETNYDVYFRHPSRDFRVTDEAFRVRQVNDRCCITYKGKRLPGPVKSRPELELDIQAAQRSQWLEMLERLGFEALPAVEKRRHNYQRRAENDAGNDSLISRIHVTMDEVQSLGTFAELELIVNDECQIESAAQAIEHLAKSLCLHDIQPRSYLSLMLMQLGLS